MNKKYLLRGIGIGIIIGSLISYAAFATSSSADTDNKKTSVSDSVETSAEEITTTEETTTEEITTEETTAEVKKAEEETTEVVEETTEETTEEVTTEEKTTEEKTTEEKTTEEKTTEEKTTEKVADSKTATITIKPGMGSEEVSALLKDAGLIDDDVKYNSWLMSKGYDSKLCVGTFEIKKGSSDEEIAKILTTLPK